MNVSGYWRPNIHKADSPGGLSAAACPGALVNQVIGIYIYLAITYRPIWCLSLLETNCTHRHCLMYQVHTML